MLPFIFIVTLVVLAIGLLMFLRSQKSTVSKSNMLAQVRERAEQRKLDRAFMNTEPVEDAYDRSYDLTLAMSAVEVDESANGYGMLDDEQKRIIAAIFEGQSQVPSSFDTRPVHGARTSHSVFGELNKVAPIPDKDIWSASRN